MDLMKAFDPVQKVSRFKLYRQFNHYKEHWRYNRQLNDFIEGYWNPTGQFPVSFKIQFLNTDSNTLWEEKSRQPETARLYLSRVHASLLLRSFWRSKTPLLLLRGLRPPSTLLTVRLQAVSGLQSLLCPTDHKF